MSKIRRGLNERNIEQWKEYKTEHLSVVFNNQQAVVLSVLYAEHICLMQEVEKLKQRIIKLEKKNKS